MTKKILMIAGPNGAGKTTITLELMSRGPKLYEFIKADEIAKSLAPLHPESMTLTASNMNLYLPFSDTAIIMDASLEQTEIVARKINNNIHIFNQSVWQKLEQTIYEG